jgi:cytochrome c
MSYSLRTILVGAAVSFALTTLARAADNGPLGIGHVASPSQIAGWDIDVRADGQGLPPGHGSAREGEKIFAETCAACHGAKGEGKPADRLVGGFGTLATSKPVRTVGSYWPYASTLFDYIRRAMPFNSPQSLTADQVYAVSAYILYLNNIVTEDTVLDATSLPRVEMPNRNGSIQLPAGNPELGTDLRERRMKCRLSLIISDGKAFRTAWLEITSRGRHSAAAFCLRERKFVL